MTTPRMLFQQKRDSRAFLQCRALLMHMEGGPWGYLVVERYDSWQDYATDATAATPQTGTGKDPWSQVREHSSYHTDTLTDRIFPK